MEPSQTIKDIARRGVDTHGIDTFIDITVKSIDTMYTTDELIRVAWLLKELKSYPGADVDRIRSAMQTVKTRMESSAAAAGGKRRKTRRYKMPRKMSRKYCKKTSCKKMGFTQKASCRPWKNCY